jgi:molybdopterin converting factor small subunit
LRSSTNELTSVDLEGTTLGDVLGELTDRFPDLRERLFDESGGLRRFVNVYVDDEDVRMRDGLSTFTAQDSSIIILPAMAGGTQS